MFKSPPSASISSVDNELVTVWFHCDHSGVVRLKSVIMREHCTREYMVLYFKMYFNIAILLLILICTKCNRNLIALPFCNFNEIQLTFLCILIKM